MNGEASVLIESMAGNRSKRKWRPGVAAMAVREHRQHEPYDNNET